MPTPEEHPSCRVTDPGAHGPVPVTTALLLAALKAALVRKASIVSQKAVREGQLGLGRDHERRCLHRPHPTVPCHQLLVGGQEGFCFFFVFCFRKPSFFP